MKTRLHFAFVGFDIFHRHVRKADILNSKVDSDVPSFQIVKSKFYRQPLNTLLNYESHTRNYLFDRLD